MSSSTTRTWLASTRLAGCLLRRILRRDVTRPPTDRFVASVYAAVGVVRRPACGILEQADSANAPVAAKIEPVQRSAGNENQIAGFHFQRHDRRGWRMNVEQAAPGDDVADFVLVVAMLDVEFGQHGVESGRARVHIDHVGGHVPTALLQLLDLWHVGLQNLLGGGIIGEARRNWPALVLDADTREVRANLGLFA